MADTERVVVGRKEIGDSEEMEMRPRAVVVCACLSGHN